MKQFHSRAERDQWLGLAAQHVSNEQDEGRADAFSTRGQQMFEGGAQILVAVRTLGAHPIFDQQNLFLYGDKKGCVVQVSPQEKPRRVVGCHSGDLFQVPGFYFRNFISNFTHKGRFVASGANAPMGDGGEKGRIGFD